MLRIILITHCLLFTCALYGRDHAGFADSIRKKYRIPELSYAVVSADSVMEMHALGETKIHSGNQASLNDRFRIGSNTKTITGFIAALLVKQNKISWDTKFFDLFPKLRAVSRKEYLDLTLLDLLTMRARFYPYTYTDKRPEQQHFTGSDSMQRYQFVQWFLSQPPMTAKEKFNFSNVSYVAAALMLEKAAGKSYKQLVTELGKSMDIGFDFGQPNAKDPMQVWGHDTHLHPEPPGDNYKLEWLLAAGNINVTLPGYAKFIQLQLKGWAGRSRLLSKDEFAFLHFGSPGFSVGWFWDTDKNGAKYAYHIGNPGTFLTMVYIYPASNKAIVVFSNVQSEQAEQGLNILLDKLRNNYNIY